MRTTLLAALVVAAAIPASPQEWDQQARDGAGAEPEPKRPRRGEVAMPLRLAGINGGSAKAMAIVVHFRLVVLGHQSKSGDC